MQSKASTVAEYLASLPEDRRSAIEAVRKVILDNLIGGYTEGMSYGMIGYAVPHSIFPAGYHCDPKQPLPFAGLASQKGHMSLYLMCCYGNAELEKFVRDGFAKAGKKLDMGKACIRFKKLEDLALDVIGAAIRRVPVPTYVAYYQTALGGSESSKPRAKASASKPGSKTAGKATAKVKTKPTSKLAAKSKTAKVKASSPKRAGRA